MADNITPLRRSHRLRLSATHKHVLATLLQSYDLAGRDPVENFGNLLSAAVLAGRFIGQTPEEIADYVSRFVPVADAARAARPDIFGGLVNDNGGEG